MKTIKDIIHNTAFTKDLALIKQLETRNTQYQDLIWERHMNTYQKEKQEMMKKTSKPQRFKSHPAAFSSDSEDSPSRRESRCNIMKAWSEEPEVEMCNSARSSQRSPRRKKKKSSSATKIALNESDRIKLRKKLTRHLENGTLEKFEVKQIGDHARDFKKINKAKSSGVIFKESPKSSDDDPQRESTSSNSNSFSSCSSSSGDSTLKSASSSEKTEKKSSKNVKRNSKILSKKKEEKSSGSSCHSSRDDIAEEVKLSLSSKVREKMVFVDELQVEEKLKELEKKRSKNKEVKNKERSANKTRGEKKKVSKKENKKSVSLVTIGELRKARYYVEKCVSTIKDIGLILNEGIEPPDGSEDYSRRKIRTQEFAARFGRVYMYPLVTQLTSLNSINPGGRGLDKFTSLYQSMSAALLSFLNHIPFTVGTMAYNKLNEYLACVNEVCDKNIKRLEKEGNFDNLEYISVLKEQCTRLIEKSEENVAAAATSPLKSESTRTSLGTGGWKRYVKKKPNQAQKASLHKRYSMYNNGMSFRSQAQWKKAMETFDERKDQVKSRYRTATFKHRPPVDKQHSQTLFQQQQQKHLTGDERMAPSFLHNNSVVTTPINEDNIKTMVQYENEKMKRCTPLEEEEENFEEKEVDEKELEEECCKGKTIISGECCQNTCNGSNFHHHPHSRHPQTHQNHQEDILVKLLHLVQTNDQQTILNTKGEDVTLMKSIKALQECLHFKNQNSELFKKITTDADRTLSTQKTKIVNAQDQKKRRKEPVVTVTGAKNAQLICIRDDNSIASIVSDEAATDKTEKPLKRRGKENIRHENGKNLISAEVQTCSSQPTIFLDDTNDNSQYFDQLGRRQICASSKTSIRRICRPLKVLKMLPKDYALNVIQYKLMFHKHQKGNYMYRKTATIKPWEIMDKISEDILDYAFLGVAKEIEVNDLLENIYNAEFQY